MSTAELIFNKAQTLPEPAQMAVLHIVELLAQQRAVSGQSSISPGSAKGLVTMSEDFDEPLPDFEPYMK